MDTLKYIADKFGLDLNQKSPIQIFNINRPVMAQTLYELKFKVGAEIGVQQGIHAETLCKYNPDLKLYCIDPWTPVYGYTENAFQHESYYQETLRRLTPYNCIFMRQFSMDALDSFSDGELDFVYIDAGHDFKNVAMDLCEWPKKVKRDGIVFGHDFKRHSRHRGAPHHVVGVVSAYTYEFGINPWFILGTPGHSDGKFAEGTRSWMFVKSQ
jgi:hypothetical protein